MGSTGRSSGTHLHFSVHRDDGNGLWDGDKQDLGVDPFGWSGIGVDPWVAEGGGPVSHWLWLHRLQRTTDFLGSQGTTLRSGSGDIQVDVPARAFQGQLQMELETGGTADGLDPNLRSAGGAFRVGILEWLDGGEQQRSAVESGAVDNVRPAVPLEISALLEESTVRHLDLSQLTFAVRGAGQTDWTPLGVELDPESGLATTSSSQLGDFVLAAPLHCPQDVMEPDDHTYLATTLSLGTPITRTLDIDADQDWFQLEVEAGSEYRWQVRSEGEVATELVLLDGDGIGELARSADTGSDLLWTAPRSGVIFARVTPTGPTGCEARYGVIVQLSE